MKCKTFKIQLSDEAGDFGEVKFNKFLETVAVNRVFASLVSNEFWSVVVFYEENATVQNFPKETLSLAKETSSLDTSNAGNIQSINTFKESKESQNKPAIAPVEPIVLTAEQEKRYLALRNWRNEQASQNGLAPYMIAHNDSLMQIAVLQVKSKEELLPVKGFGEKRVEKYGDEILRILNEAE